MKSNSSFLTVKKFEKVNSSFFLRVYTNISTAKAASIHWCFSTCGRISFFFPGDTTWVGFSSFKKHVLLCHFLNGIFFRHLAPFFFKFTQSNQGTRIRTGITCKKIPCYMRDSACWWFIVKKAKIFLSYVKHFWILVVVRKYRILIGLCK